MKWSVFTSALVLLAGVGLGRMIGVSEFLTVAMGLLSGLLVAFPAVKQMMGTPVSFKLWALTVGFGAFATWLIYLVMGR
jgi:hypothetical protein